MIGYNDLMPTVLRADGFRVVINTNDHEPMHVHVYHGHGTTEGVTIFIGHPTERPIVHEVKGMSDPDIARALAVVQRHQGWLITNWRLIHGET